MGLKNYFQPIGKDAASQQRAPAAVALQPLAFSELPPASPMKSSSKRSPVSCTPSVMQRSSLSQPRPSLNDRLSPTSPAGSSSPNGDFRQLMDIKAEVMVTFLHHRQQAKMWTSSGWDEGVVLKKAKDDYTSSPSELQNNRNGLYDSVKKLNVKVRGPDALRKNEY